MESRLVTPECSDPAGAASSFLRNWRYLREAVPQSEWRPGNLGDSAPHGKMFTLSTVHTVLQCGRFWLSEKEACFSPSGLAC